MQNNTHIFDKNTRIIKHCRKSLLYNNHEYWKKEDTDSCFDVTMGSYDGAEVCDLVGIYLLSLLANIIDKNNSGLYHDDELIFLCNVNGQKMDRVRKNVMKIFKEVRFKIEIQTHLKLVNFLDMTFNLANGTYRHYKKANESLLYINTSSNPPFSRNVTTNVAQRFLNLLDIHFPKSNKLHKIFNRNTVKVSYCCTENLSSIIKTHNK